MDNEDRCRRADSEAAGAVSAQEPLPATQSMWIPEVRPADEEPLDLRGALEDGVEVQSQRVFPVR